MTIAATGFIYTGCPEKVNLLIVVITLSSANPF